MTHDRDRKAPPSSTSHKCSRRPPHLLLWSWPGSTPGRHAALPPPHRVRPGHFLAAAAPGRVWQDKAANHLITYGIQLGAIPGGLGTWSGKQQRAAHQTAHSTKGLLIQRKAERQNRRCGGLPAPPPWHLAHAFQLLALRTGRHGMAHSHELCMYRAPPPGTGLTCSSLATCPWCLRMKPSSSSTLCIKAAEAAAAVTGQGRAARRPGAVETLHNGGALGARRA